MRGLFAKAGLAPLKGGRKAKTVKVATPLVEVVVAVEGIPYRRGYCGLPLPLTPTPSQEAVEAHRQGCLARQRDSQSLARVTAKFED